MSNNPIFTFLDDLNLAYQAYDHEPVLDYETAAMVDEKYHIEGVESKSLLMKAKSGKYILLVTTSDQRMDRKYMKELIGEKVSIASPEELMALSGYEAGCAAPNCYPKDVLFLIDNFLFTLDKIIISGGVPTQSASFDPAILKTVYAHVDNEVKYLDDVHVMVEA